MNRTWVPRGIALLALVLAVGCGAQPSGDSLVMGEAAVGSGGAEPPPGLSEGPDPSGDSTEPPVDTSVPPSTGITMSGQGYSYRAPKEWTDITKQMKESGQNIDSAVGEDLADVTSVRENLNVVLTPAPGVTLENYEDIAPESLKFMVKNLETFPRVTIAGEEAVHVGGVAKTGEASFYFEQFAIMHDGTMYAVSFAVDGGRSESDRRNLIDSVLASWKWPA